MRFSVSWTRLIESSDEGYSACNAVDFRAQKPFFPTVFMKVTEVTRPEVARHCRRLALGRFQAQTSQFESQDELASLFRCLGK
jgi:hypothetical protein